MGCDWVLLVASFVVKFKKSLQFCQFSQVLSSFHYSPTGGSGSGGGFSLRNILADDGGRDYYSRSSSIQQQQPPPPQLSSSSSSSTLQLSPNPLPPSSPPSHNNNNEQNMSDVEIATTISSLSQIQNDKLNYSNGTRQKNNSMSISSLIVNTVNNTINPINNSVNNNVNNPFIKIPTKEPKGIVKKSPQKRRPSDSTDYSQKQKIHHPNSPKFHEIRDQLGKETKPNHLSPASVSQVHSMDWESQPPQQPPSSQQPQPLPPSSLQSPQPYPRSHNNIIIIPPQSDISSSSSSSSNRYNSQPQPPPPSHQHLHSHPHSSSISKNNGMGSPPMSAVDTKPSNMKSPYLIIDRNDRNQKSSSPPIHPNNGFSHGGMVGNHLVKHPGYPPNNNGYMHPSEMNPSNIQSRRVSDPSLPQNSNPMSMSRNNVLGYPPPQINGMNGPPIPDQQQQPPPPPSHSHSHSNHRLPMNNSLTNHRNPSLPNVLSPSESLPPQGPPSSLSHRNSTSSSSSSRSGSISTTLPPMQSSPTHPSHPPHHHHHPSSSSSHTHHHYPQEHHNHSHHPHAQQQQQQQNHHYHHSQTNQPNNYISPPPPSVPLTPQGPPPPPPPTPSQHSYNNHVTGKSPPSISMGQPLTNFLRDSSGPIINGYGGNPHHHIQSQNGVMNGAMNGGGIMGNSHLPPPPPQQQPPPLLPHQQQLGPPINGETF
ncbi:7519_t:CDS:10 [Diversispora eburnea]|uniref:7519_t:CDS:1 n=1 Tax=Diversispora eburnea TaxID=1213867 RepID=A0A9N8V634_9GLOM|nr:7519_t:CDS:10 [Diversispora eburnea]